MAKAPKTPAPDDRTALQAALQAVQAQAAAIKAKRDEALRTLAKDPVGGAKAVNQFNAQLAEAEGQAGVLETALEQFEAEDLQRAAQARIAASAQARRRVVDLTGKIEATLAPDVDRAFAELHRALIALMAAGQQRAAAAQQALVAMHGGDTTKLHDALSITLGRAYGNGTDSAIAFTHQVKRLADVMDGPALAGVLAINAFMPHAPASMARAAELDGKTLVEWFKDKPAEPIATEVEHV